MDIPGRVPTIVRPFAHYAICLIVVTLAGPVVADEDDKPVASPSQPSADSQEFTVLDRDGDGFVTLREIIEKRPREEWQDAGALFYRSDVDGDGRLSPNEFVEQGKGELLRPDVVFTRIEKVLRDIAPIWRAADRDGDGRVTAREWSEQKIAEMTPHLAGLPFGDWDRDGDGGVTREERRALVEIAFGICRTDGQMLRKPDGHVFYWQYMRRLDKNHDDELSREEFVTGYYEGPEKSAERFARWDKDKDGRLPFAELAALGFFQDVYAEFCKFDADMDGQVTVDEALAQISPAEQALARRIVPAFDVNGDGTLAVDEFVLSPWDCPLGNWNALRNDADNDGRLSWTEYYTEKSPVLYGLYRYFFRRLDRDGDGFLSQTEFDFPVDVGHRLLGAALASLDSDGDRRLNRDEYERATASYKFEVAFPEEFARFDLDRDGFLSLLEFAYTPRGKYPAAELFPILDANGDGFLTLREIIQNRPREEWQRTGVLFHRSDVDRDGRLSPEELMQQGKGGRVRPDAVIARSEQVLRDIEPICRSVDRDGDGRVTAGEWPEQKIAEAAPDLGELPFADWDRNGDGGVTAAERRALVEIAFGIRRTDGQVLRKPEGYVFYWQYTRWLDKNHDDELSRDEFITGYYEGAEKNAERFAQWDKDKDGRLTFAEVATDGFFQDVYAEFCKFDADLDGQVTLDEVLAQVSPTEKGIARRIVLAFDLNGDGALAVDEFGLSPFDCPLTAWNVLRNDANNDGRLSWTEFYPEQSPELYGLYGYFFGRLDRDGDGFLSPGEFEFPFKFESVPKEAALAALDADGDGRLTIEEAHRAAKNGPQPTTPPGR